MVLPFNYCFNLKCSFCYFSTSLLVCLFVCLFVCLLVYLFNFSFIYVIVNLNEQFCLSGWLPKSLSLFIYFFLVSVLVNM